MLFGIRLSTGDLGPNVDHAACDRSAKARTRINSGCGPFAITQLDHIESIKRMSVIGSKKLSMLCCRKVVFPFGSML